MVVVESAANMPYYVAMATAPEYITVNTAPFEIQYSRFIDSSGPHALLILLLRGAKSVKLRAYQCFYSSPNLTQLSLIHIIGLICSMATTSILDVLYSSS